jgi:hypothetical protein
MKKSILLLLTILLLPTNVIAGSRSGYSRDVKCYKTVYREEYIPGTRRNPGYVRTYTDKKEIPCKKKVKFIHPHPHHNHNSKKHVDDNSCVEGTVVGGILGGAAGGTLATKKNWIWSIPLGVVSGAMVGCQVDGG